MQVKTIKEFRFNKAEYLVKRDKEALILVIDYKNNTFKVLKESPVVSNELEIEAREIAEDLLRRKHGVNFAEH